MAPLEEERFQPFGHLFVVALKNHGQEAKENLRGACTADDVAAVGGISTGKQISRLEPCPAEAA